MKAFKIAQSGPTTDGREIKPQWLHDFAETYDKTVYTARMWVEHLRGLYPSSDFRAAGDVARVFVEENDGIVSLFGELEPNEYGKQLNAADQKIFTSIEVTENFANSGKAYLTGLGLTDSPASLGTDKLKFSKFNGFNNHQPNVHHFHMTAELDLSNGWDGGSTDDSGKAFNFVKALTEALKNAFGKKDAETVQPAATPSLDYHNLIEPLSGVMSQALTEHATQFKQQIDNLQGKYNALEQRFNEALTQEQSNAVHHSARPTSTGGDASGYQKADC